MAADANPITGVPIVVNGSLSPPFIWGGGTSLASPLTMAMTTLWQDYINAKGMNYKIGQAAPVAYQLWYELGRNAYTGSNPIFINVPTASTAPTPPRAGWSGRTSGTQ